MSDLTPPRVLPLCVECGPNVRLDEDGLCCGCGATATGNWLAKNQKRVAEMCFDPAGVDAPIACGFILPDGYPCFAPLPCKSHEWLWSGLRRL